MSAGLNILHISAADSVGGSGRSAYRLHTGLRARGHRSRMLVNYRASQDPDVGYIWRALGWRAADWLVRSATERLSLQYLYYPSSYALVRHPWFAEADVMQLYNTHGGYFSHSALALLSRYKPVVWRLSDMWPMTGHCAYPYDCQRWKTGCGSCPLLTDAPALHTDRTALLWKTKRSVYARSHLVIVAPSRWMAQMASESPLIGRFPIHVIPNGLDIDLFRPISKPVARELFRLNPTERIVLFVAIETAARRKGGALLEQALARVLSAGGPRFRLMVVGQGASEWTARLHMPVSAVPLINDDRLLAAAYSAADVLMMPTRAENLPNTILESMACGTPVVAFDVGGVRDAVRAGETGWLVPAEDVEALAGALNHALTDDGLRARLGQRCREVVEREYTAELQTDRFEALYRELPGSPSRGERTPNRPAAAGFV